ncbi:hypothetical protein A1O3_07962 [Capronia epimyces CBS 606.96]|uniref:Magnesium transporter NIPA n=1 Tax=Capronia epimyces CBS 606.96 TaxID=1182542 RepID=W9XRR2_9EURO|nr:uncharacterized protein A1O3_07962 [Capronia epimyces CBS 606.96]EXJ79681.1 hypothetical protein A1O3_07962 [Capronia epimyces CBS 606.96]
MHIPTPVTPNTYPSSLLGFLVQISDAQPGDDAERQQRWSSFIGIVTAIVGNLLISFALNTQRYAHILINRERNQARSQHSKGRIPPRKPSGYGSARQEDLVAGRERKNQGIHERDPDADRSLNGSSTDESLPIPFDARNSKKGHEKDAHNEDRPSYLKSPYWWLGFVLMVIGEAGNFLAYGFAPAHIVSPLGVVALISNCLIAPLMLHERFRKRDFWGVLIAIAGAVTVVLSSKTSEEKLGPGELWRTIKRWEFLLYVILTLLLIVVLMYMEPRYGRKTILLDLGLVALFGGYTALSTKGIASLLSASLWKAFTYPISYFLAFVLIGSALMQIRYLNRALQSYDSTQVIPTQFVLFTLSVIIGSAVLYRDFEHTTAGQAVKFILGCLLTFFGVYLITSAREEHRDVDDEIYYEDETLRLLDEEAEDAGEQTTFRRENTERSVRPRSTVDLTTSDQDEPDSLLTPRRLSTASTVPSIAVTPAESTDTLSANPWLSSTEEVDPPLAPRTPQINRLQSEPGSAPFYRPATSKPLDRTRSLSADLETPGKQGISQLPSPIRPFGPGPEGPSPAASFLTRSARGSISRLLPVPGPLVPPLSSSLSALVADSLLKGEGGPFSVRIANRRSQSAYHVTEGSRRTVPVEDHENPLTLDNRGQNADGDSSRTVPMPSVQHQDYGEQQDDPGTAKRKPKLRALSETISDMMRHPKGKGTGKRRDDFADEM